MLRVVRVAVTPFATTAIDCEVGAMIERALASTPAVHDFVQVEPPP
jgi:hypothetical protein